VWAEQAIFTSLPRRGRAGYHLVARSGGISDGEAAALTTWSPSHGALIIDEANPCSVNFHSLPGGRYALSRTRAGTAEYSGRGGRQLYTHTVVIDDRTLRRAGNHPCTVYRDALALGHLRYRADPETTLPAVRLSWNYPTLDAAAWTRRAQSLGLPTHEEVLAKLASGQAVELAYDGDRRLLVEGLIGRLPPEIRHQVSFATSLRPSMVRPYQLVLLEPNRRDRLAR
jgi:hypothetical protein